MNIRLYRSSGGPDKDACSVARNPMNTEPCATIRPDTLDVQPTQGNDDVAITIGTPGAYGKEAERRLTRIRERDKMHSW